MWLLPRIVRSPHAPGSQSQRDLDRVLLGRLRVDRRARRRPGEADHDGRPRGQSVFLARRSDASPSPVSTTATWTSSSFPPREEPRPASPGIPARTRPSDGRATASPFSFARAATPMRTSDGSSPSRATAAFPSPFRCGGPRTARTPRMERGSRMSPTWCGRKPGSDTAGARPRRFRSRGFRIWR